MRYWEELLILDDEDIDHFLRPSSYILTSTEVTSLPFNLRTSTPTTPWPHPARRLAHTRRHKHTQGAKVVVIPGLATSA
jgi:hypothetical protein